MNPKPQNPKTSEPLRATALLRESLMYMVRSMRKCTTSMLQEYQARRMSATPCSHIPRGDVIKVLYGLVRQHVLQYFGKCVSTINLSNEAGIRLLTMFRGI